MRLLAIACMTAFTLVAFSREVTGQDAVSTESPIVRVTIVVLDGRNGKPMKNQQLLMDTGPFLENAFVRNPHLETRTDRNGIAIINLDTSRAGWILVAPDFRALCNAGPTTYRSSLDLIVSRGLSMPNDCGKASGREPRPGELIVYARPLRFREALTL
jgi:hypothetical protein